MPTKLIARSAVAGVALALGLSLSAGATEKTSVILTVEELADGEALYLKNCRMCHGTKGTSGKRLAGNESVADATYVASTILVGPGYMTPFAEHLSDAEIALITTYIRNAWGHAYGKIDAAEVAPLR